MPTCCWMRLRRDLHVLAQLPGPMRPGLVQQKDPGPVEPGPGDGHPLLLAAGEESGLRFQSPPADDLQHLHDPPRISFSGIFTCACRWDRRSGRRCIRRPKAIFSKTFQMGNRAYLEHRVDLFMGRNVINPHTVKEDVSGRRCREASTMIRSVVVCRTRWALAVRNSLSLK